ncbi:hypothetical protein FISHEDRAFT_17012, partial [Fistulina hepatica ATCC 64428]
FEGKPSVWTGKIIMPLDASMSQEASVVTRQIAGHSMAHDSLLWRTLFPSDVLRIDGRVPVESSAKYLAQMRMNESKELIGVAFSMASEHDTAFQMITELLIGKNRHGLIFPWGQHPKDTSPGRELYIIPLLSSDPVPDYVQLLDSFRLPHSRSCNFLIGVFVLNKGKLNLPIPGAAAAPGLPPPALVPPLAPMPYPNMSIPNAPPQATPIPWSDTSVGAPP